MEKRTRRILYYPLLAIFIAALPLLLLYALGISLDWRDQTVTQTGGVFIKSRVPRLSIYLDSQQMKQTGFFSGSALITDVSTGVHVIRLEREGYRQWMKTVSVSPLDVVELRNILLIPENLARATTSAEDLPATSTPSAARQGVQIDKENRLLYSESGTTTILTENVHSFDAPTDTIYFVNNFGFLGAFDAAGAIETLGHPGFYLAEKPFSFSQSTKKDILIIDSGGGLFLVDSQEPVRPVENAVLAAAFDSRGDKILIQKENELSVLWLVENKTQPFQKRFTKETIIRTPTPIIRSAWFYSDNSHVIFQTSEGIFITETDGRGGRNTFELFRGETDDFFVSPDEPNRIFGKQDKIWYSIEL
ncbi:MAG: hypothetical protein UY61_C0041G0003 [Candidatus Adlerbacteria bacterium GW2011_GWC1_50_9]|uniref:PEGA domain-containing protein n=2 Tax=Parcubacteria group TaxID=1794811 RepID=A0A0G1YZ09_9BACT|nr:MAG: hypothetical protein UY61_C0041G0003 [Candidatus Adlerbacteria bacterium GW2011_GWC1_50_9]KKW30182.1 MAG: hypothetical protein UY74_C0048G0004 [Candidatus Kaiserbacteria bacterium GW2011_GWC2_52_8b]